MKKIGNTYYIHRFYVGSDEANEILPKELTKLLMYKGVLPIYTVVKYDIKTRKCSLIYCPNFDIEREPTIKRVHHLDEFQKDTWSFYNATEYKGPNFPIYHHKWMFVQDDYHGFDIEESKEWSKKWEPYATPTDKRKIGYTKGWEQFLIKHKLY